MRWPKYWSFSFSISPSNEHPGLISFRMDWLEEESRMGKTRDLVEKIRDTKVTFHAKMGSIKDRNGMDLTEAEGIKKR